MQRTRWFRLRNILLVGLLAIAVSVTWVVVETYRVANAQPSTGPDFRAVFLDDVKQHVQLGPDDGAKAWRLLVETAADVERLTRQYANELEQSGFKPRFEYDTPPDFLYVTSGATLPADTLYERNAIARLETHGVLDALAQFVELSPGYNAMPGHGLDILMTNSLPHVRELSKMRLAAMRFALDNGDHEEVVRSFEQVMAVAHTVSIQPGLLHILYSIALAQMAYDELHMQLVEGRFDAETCSQLAGILDRYALPPMTLLMGNVRVDARSSIQQWYSDDGNGNGYLLVPLPDLELTIAASGSSELTVPDAFVSRFLLADRRSTTTMVEDFIDKTLAEAQKPVQDRWQAFDPETAAEKLPWRHTMAASIVSLYKNFVEADTRYRSQHRAMKLAVSLAWHRAKHGTYPQPLATLDNAILAELPTDPINGESFGYRLLDDDEHDRPYLLYSFGIDGVDNDGHQATKPNAAIVMNEDGYEGYDYIYNTPRHEWAE